MPALRLNRSAPFGKISPPSDGEDFSPPLPFDRPAHFEQAGRFFDVHGREIVPGEPLDPEDIPDGNAADVVLASRGSTPAELIAQVDSLPFPRWRRAAETLLGKGCPRSRDQILARLQLLAKGVEPRTVVADPRVGVAIGAPSAETLADQEDDGTETHERSERDEAAEWEEPDEEEPNPGDDNVQALAGDSDEIEVDENTAGEEHNDPAQPYDGEPEDDDDIYDYSPPALNGHRTPLAAKPRAPIHAPEPNLMSILTHAFGGARSS
jgi:hypothetical protein